jgi:hypothetical protein
MDFSVKNFKHRDVKIRNEYPKHLGRIRTRDIWFIPFYFVLFEHLFIWWNEYKCGSNFNLVMLSIYIFHVVRRIVLHFRNQYYI